MDVGMCLKKGHRCSTPHLVVKIFLTYKTAFLILHPTKRKFLSININQYQSMKFLSIQSHVKSYADIGVCTVLIPFLTGIGVIVLYTLTGIAF